MATFEPFMPLLGPSLVISGPTGIHWGVDNQCCCCRSLTREGCAIPLPMTWVQAAPLCYMDSRRAADWLQKCTRDTVLQVQAFRWTLHGHEAIDEIRGHGWRRCIVVLRHDPTKFALEYTDHGPMAAWMALRA